MPDMNYKIALLSAKVDVIKAETKVRRLRQKAGRLILVKDNRR